MGSSNGTYKKVNRFKNLSFASDQLNGSLLTEAQKGRKAHSDIIAEAENFDEDNGSDGLYLPSKFQSSSDLQ